MQGPEEGERDKASAVGQRAASVRPSLQGQIAPRPGDLPALKGTGIPVGKGAGDRNIKVTVSQASHKYSGPSPNLPSSLGIRNHAAARAGFQGLMNSQDGKKSVHEHLGVGRSRAFIRIQRTLRPK